MKVKEIEIKFKINKYEYTRILKLLKKENYSFSEKHQVDMYYAPSGENYYGCGGNQCLRIRSEGERFFLGYKRIYNINLSNQYIEEYEVEFDNLASLEKILVKLGFEKKVTVDKYRTEGLIYSEFLIALDYVKNLGYFLEIENINEEKSLKERNKSLLDFIDLLNIDMCKRNNEGYSNMLYNKLNIK